MTRTALQVLVTGFGAFPGVEENPSAFLIEQLRHTFPPLIENVQIHPHMLETSWEQAPKKLAILYSDIKPDIALHFGYAQSAQGFCLERFARNRTIAAMDHYGDMPPFSQVLVGGSSKYETKVPVSTIVKYLGEGQFQAHSSTDAGCYLCNMIYYLSSSFAKTTKGRKVHSLFVHIPSIQMPSGKLMPPEAEGKDSFVMSHQQLVTGVWHMIRFLRDFHIMEEKQNSLM